MSTNPDKKNLSTLFSDLVKYERINNYQQALKVADKILSLEKDNIKAGHCKVVCLIQESQFTEALDEITRNPAFSEECIFEKAYCEYRLNKADDCLKTLDSHSEPDFREKELRCQALYRLEKYQEAYDLYLELLKESADDSDNEREANLAAVAAGLAQENPKAVENLPQLEERENFYEIYYNKACIELSRENYPGARQILNDAEEICRKSLEGEGWTEEEIDSELAIIRGQLGYVDQMLGDLDSASKMYNQALKLKPTDPLVIAVACNNIVTINKDQNIFDSRKKTKQALNEINNPKLSVSQRRSIVFNNCLLLLLTNQSDACRKQLIQFKTMFPEATVDSLILEAALLRKERKVNDAIEILRKYKNYDPDNIEAPFIIIQLLLSEGRHKEALSQVTELQNKQKLALISIMVALHLNLEDKVGAIKVLKTAISWFQTNKPKGSELIILYRKAAKLMMENKDHKGAVVLLEELRKHNPDNPKVLAHLISAYSQIDPAKAKEIMQYLPPLEQEIAGVDVDALETSNWSLGAKYVKKITKVEPSPGNIKEDIKKTKKRKKKKQLPKKFDPDVDPNPERWLPRWQRSTYKKKKDKRGTQFVGKGTQGAVGGAEPEPTSKSSPKPGASNVEASPNLKGPRMAQKKQKKKPNRR